MGFEYFISIRYLLAKRRQTFISLVTFISIAGVAVGVTALIVVLAVMNGFQEDLRGRILGVTSHINVTSYSGSIANYREVMAQIEKEKGVVGATPFIYAPVMMTSGRSAGAVLRGIDPLSGVQGFKTPGKPHQGRTSRPGPAFTPDFEPILSWDNPWRRAG